MFFVVKGGSKGETANVATGAGLAGGYDEAIGRTFENVLRQVFRVVVDLAAHGALLGIFAINLAKCPPPGMMFIYMYLNICLFYVYIHTGRGTL